MENKDETTLLEKVYAKLNELRKEAAEDIKIDKGSIETQFNSQQKVVKWLNKRIDWYRSYTSIEAKRKEAWKKAYEYYRTDYPMKLNNAEEYRMMIESDPTYSVIMNEAIAIQETLSYIDSVIDALKGRAFDVSNLSKWLMWTNGNR